VLSSQGLDRHREREERRRRPEWGRLATSAYTRRSRPAILGRVGISVQESCTPCPGRCSAAPAAPTSGQLVQPPTNDVDRAWRGRTRSAPPSPAAPDPWPLLEQPLRHRLEPVELRAAAYPPVAGRLLLPSEHPRHRAPVDPQPADDPAGQARAKGVVHISVPDTGAASGAVRQRRLVNGPYALGGVAVAGPTEFFN